MNQFVANILRFLPDKQYIQLQYFKNFKRFPNLRNPQSFNEKLQWLKLYDRRPEYTILVDKYLVKDYVRIKIGDQFVTPTLAAYNHANEIDFDSLPQQFVIKWNHDSGSIVICKDKNKLNIPEVIRILDKCEDGRQGYWYGREWPYKNIIPKLIVEQYIDGGEDLIDYKLLCFNGKVKCLFTGSRRFSKEGLHINFYDKEWNLLPFTRKYPNDPNQIPKPNSLNKMIDAAEILAEGIPLARIDFYEIVGKPLFGEITLYPGSGLEPFQPVEWDYKLGSWLDLPNKR